MNNIENKKCINRSLTDKQKYTEIVNTQLNKNGRICSPSCMMFSFEGILTICKDERNIVEVNFKGKKKEFYLNNDRLILNYFDYVIVETDNGYDIGYISELEHLTRIKRRNLGLFNEPLKKIVSIAKDKDIYQLNIQRKEEEKAKNIFYDLITKHRLDLKLIDIEIQFDRNRMTFYFTSENRVDFRLLVKDLASIFRTRIELRQIGIRDGMKKFGALASCGRELCCCSFLDDVKKVSINEVKDQKQFINPNKLNGQCGRLKCCMSFESELYCEASQKFPELHSTIRTNKGEATIESVDIFNEKVILYYPKTETKEVFDLLEFYNFLKK